MQEPKIRDKCWRCNCNPHCKSKCTNCEECDVCDCIHCLSPNDWWMPDREDKNKIKLFKNAGNGQEEIRNVAYKYVKKWRGCIDAGANVGMWTRNLMKKFDMVHAFEPNPLFIDCWNKNISSKQNVILYPVGLGHNEHTATFERQEAQILSRVPGNIIVKTLDSFNLSNIDFIKIDVDGYEDLLIQGSRKTIVKNRPVINIEMKRFKSRMRRQTVRIVEKVLIKLNYKPIRRTRSDEVWVHASYPIKFPRRLDYSQ